MKSNRAFLLGLAAALGAALVGTSFIAPTVKPAAFTPRAAVTFFNGSGVDGSTIGKGSLLANSAANLHLPAVANNLFFSLFYKSNWIFAATAPLSTKHPLFGNSDGINAHSLAVNIIPPNPLFTAHLNQPMLSIELANPVVSGSARWLVPDMLQYDNNWHHLMLNIQSIGVGAARVFSPLFAHDNLLYQPVAVNSANIAQPSIYTPAFNVPLIDPPPSALLHDKYMYWLGQEITSQLTGMRPMATSYQQIYQGKLAQVLFYPNQSIDMAQAIATNKFVADPTPLLMSQSTLAAQLAQMRTTLSSGMSTIFTTLAQVRSLSVMITADVQQQLRASMQAAQAQIQTAINQAAALHMTTAQMSLMNAATRLSMASTQTITPSNIVSTRTMLSSTLGSLQLADASAMQSMLNTQVMNYVQAQNLPQNGAIYVGVPPIYLDGAATYSSVTSNGTVVYYGPAGTDSFTYNNNASFEAPIGFTMPAPSAEDPYGP